MHKDRPLQKIQDAISEQRQKHIHLRRILSCNYSRENARSE